MPFEAVSISDFVYTFKSKPNFTQIYDMNYKSRDMGHKKTVN